INIYLYVMSMNSIMLNGGLHFRKPSTVSLMVWDSKFFFAVNSLDEKDRVVSISRKGKVIVMKRKRLGVKLNLRKPQVRCSANAILPSQIRPDFLGATNYARIKVKIFLKEWGLCPKDFIKIEDISKNSKRLGNKDERIELNAGFRFWKKHAMMTIFNKPLAERIEELGNVHGVSYWDGEKIVVSIGEGYKFTPAVSHGQVKISATNLMKNNNYKKYVNERNWILIKIQLEFYSKLKMNYTDFFSETTEQKELAEAFYADGYRVARDTYSSKYGMDLFLDKSAIEITNQKPSLDKRKNVLAGSRWGGIAARILKVIYCSSEIKEPHFMIINQKWKDSVGKTFVSCYIDWLARQHNVHVVFANFEDKTWASNTSKKILDIISSQSRL
ncbi:MAG: hypothetical protein ABIA12_02350, partial [Candidatus Aenigmatarchaeota archaeon]